MSDALLTVEDLQTHLPTADGLVRAVDGVDFTVERGETVCLVGESGSGKTLTCDSITGLVGHPDADISGRVAFDERDLLAAGESTMRSVRGDRIGYVFQNAQSALDPVYTVGEQIVEAMSFHDTVDGTEGRERAVELLRTVGISRPEQRVDQYPHEFSDGMCQRAAIAIGLAAAPDLLIADEPTSAVDVTIQARIIDLLERIQAERDLSLLLVTHDLRVVSALADRVVVLYDGRVVERGPLSSVFGSPGHPYTQALLRSFTGDGERSDDAADGPAPDGCPFRNECPHAVDACAGQKPAFHAVGGATDHEAACVFHGPDRDPATVMAEAPRFGDGPGGASHE
ncbi:ABC transporter ATP-binding protein [Natronomonas marina]|jgi:peptide/nickel transport system ATP-binding protein|uniref:ABC transporter ATP-binding protein n=1 Tax=Natronomonas marina TaxID=2961939 RepID=UPI0020C93CCE|nr:ABC transporter ATP-binding protein [Natronomonas marina]